MSVVITGATGLLGRTLYAAVGDMKDVTIVKGCGFSRAKAPLLKVDLASKNDVSELLDGVDVVIHCAAERRPDNIQNDPEKAKTINVSATANLANCCAEKKIWMLYMSTDYVFDGTNPPYAEDATPNPLQAYGVTKCDGEKECLKQGGAVLRVPILYGAVQALKESAVTILAQTLLDKGQQEGDMTFDNVNQRFPTHVRDVSAVITQLISRILTLRSNQEAMLTGIFHYSAVEQVTKLKIAQMMASHCNVDVKRIVAAPPSNTPDATRPVNAQLSMKRLEDMNIIFPTRSLQESIITEISPFLPK